MPLQKFGGREGCFMPQSGMNIESLLAAIPDAIFVVDWEGRHVEVAPTGTTLLNLPEHELLGKTFHEVFPPDSADLFLGTVRRALASRQVVQFEYSLVIEGLTTWFSATVSPTSSDTAVWIARDITERKRAEKMREVFASLGADLSRAISAPEVGRAVLRAADDLMGWNSGFIDLHSPDEDSLYWVIGYDETDGERREVPPAIEASKPGPLTQLTLKQGPQLILRDEPEVVGVTFGNQHRPSRSLMFVPIQAAEHNIGVLSIQSYRPRAYGREDLELLQALADYCSGALLRTLAEQKRQASELIMAERERRFQALVENITDVILVTDAEGRIQFVSPAIQQVLGYSAQEYMASPPYSMLHPDDLDSVQAVHRQLLEAPDRTVLTLFRHRHHNGSWRWVEAVASNRLQERGVQALVANLRDVTDRQRSERMREVFATLGRTLSQPMTPQQAARAVLLAADSLFGMEAGFVDAVMEENPGLLHSLVAYDTVEGIRSEVPYDHVGKEPGPLTRKALEEGAHLLLRADSQPGGSRAFGHHQRRSASLMFAPMRISGIPAGVLSVQSYAPNAYSAEDLELLQTLADYCGGALQRTMAELRSRRSEEARAQSERRFRALIENSSDAVLLLDQKTRVSYASPAVQRLTMFSPETFAAEPFAARVHPSDAPQLTVAYEKLLASPGSLTSMELRIADAAGNWRWIEAVWQNLIEEPGIEAVVCNFRDITERKDAEEQLRHGAFHDALTGLPNRPAFLNQLARSFGRKERRPEFGFAVLFLDLDRFKVVNDSLGHMTGDKLLIETARRLEDCLRANDLAARLGGDEFAVLLEDILLPGDATRVAERIQEAITTPFHVDGAEIFTSTSIGIALSSTGYGLPEEMLRDADTAMYRAKAMGKSRYALFDAAMHQKAVRQLQIETDLRRAVDREELLLHYQPIVSLESGAVSGLEALVRWRHPERGIVPPGEFIPIAEETDLIGPIGWWVLNHACQWMRAWQVESSVGRRLSINVNLSARQFTQPDLVNRIQSILEQTGLDPRCLKLEITESAIIENAEASIRMLARLKELEVQLHVDDFGTGYSSLAYLHRFPIDALKIDRSFVQNLGKSEEALEISRAVIALAHNMGMEAIAEGIETREQLECLRRLGCRYAQGYYFSRPVSDDRARLLADRIFPV